MKDHDLADTFPALRNSTPRLSLTGTRNRAALVFALVAALVALAVLPLSPEAAQAQAGGPTVSGVAVTSDAGDDDTYILGDVISVTLTFSETVAVDTTGGTPTLSIDMDPAEWGTKHAAYASGSGTTGLVFTHTVVEPNYSTQGIAVLEDTLELNGGAIQSASSQTDADLAHVGLAHDANHKVDWHLSPPSPTVSGVAVTSDAGDDDTYILGDVISVTLTFSETVAVDTTGGTPTLSIDMDPAEWGTKHAAYASGSGTTGLVFTHTVVEPNYSTQGIAVLEDTLELNGGAIQSASSQTDADLAHVGLAHDANHKVDAVKKKPAKIGTGNDAPVCTGSADISEVKYAPPLHLARHLGLDCGDADGDELTFTVTSDPPGVAKRMWYDSSINRVWFQALGHCDLEAVVPELPDPFTTTVTVTATDPHGASATGKAYFRTWYETKVNGLPTGCPNLVSAKVSVKDLTLTFDVKLDERSAPAPSDFVVKVDGAAVALAEASAVEVDYTSVTLTLAEEVSESQTITVSYTPGDDPIQDGPLFGAVAAEAFEDYTVEYVKPTPTVVSVALVSAPSVDTNADGVNDTYKMGEVVRARVTFDQPVDVVGNPVLYLQLGGSSGQKSMSFDTSRLTTNTTTLDFTYTVARKNLSTQGIAFYADTMKLSFRRVYDSGPPILSGGLWWRSFKDIWDTIRASGDEIDADLSFARVDHDPGHKVDAAGPVFRSVEVNGAAIQITLNEPPDPASVPAGSAFSVRARPPSGASSGGSSKSKRLNVVSGSVAVNGATLTATLNPAALPGESVTFYYVKPDTNPLRDSIGNETGQYDHGMIIVTNNTGLPTVSSVAIPSDAGGGDTHLIDDVIPITVTFSEAVDVTGSPQLSIDLDPAEWGTKQAAYEGGG